VPSIYGLKSRFLGLLRPLARTLARAGVTANEVTLFAGALSIGFGLLLTMRISSRPMLLLAPVIMFVRMALNAIDGILAREFGQKSALGAYLNELGDVVSDAFLYLPFAYLPGFDPVWMGANIVLSVISEMTGTVAAMTGASRRYDGPMGKSDRALVFGALALWLGLGLGLAFWASYWFPRLMALALSVTVMNRVRNGLAEMDAVH
jgi:CDP-diacylglycerol--glycerol-3-phosphate 3-phosphatidyltransferase